MAPRVSFDARMVGLPGIGRFITGLWGGLHDLGADVVGLWPGTGVRHWLGEHHYRAAGPHVTVRARPFLPAEQLVVPRVLSSYSSRNVSASFDQSTSVVRASVNCTRIVSTNR